MFISFEGIEGSGKSTLIAAVAAELQARGLETVQVREPGGTPAGDAIREVVLRRGTSLTPMTELLLMNASRAELVAHVIRPMLAEGVAVLCDRYVHSSYAYQSYGRGIPMQLVRMTCAAATGGLMPDLTFYVDISYATSQKRVTERARESDRIEEEHEQFFERVRAGYRELAAQDTARIVQIDGEETPDQVTAGALASLERLFA